MSRLLVEAGLILGVIVIAMLFYFQRKNRNGNNYFLMLTLLCSWGALFINYLNSTRVILEYPFFIRTGNIPAYLIFSFLYVYVRNTFYPGRLWKKTDIVLLIPALFYVLDMLPFFFSPADYKIAVMKANLDYPDRMFRVSEGWIAIKGFHFVFRYLWSVLLMLLLVRLFYRNGFVDLKSKDSLNRSVFWFLITLTALHVPLVVPGIFGAIFHLKWFSLSYMNNSLAMVLIATTVFILFSPRVLYGFLPHLVITDAGQLKDEPVFAMAAGNNPEPVHDLMKLRIAESEMTQIVEKIQSFMADRKPFTNQHYSIHDLSGDIGIPVYQLSPIINGYYHSNFNTWLNKFRVEHFIRIIQEQGKSAFTLDAISREAGFTNRTTFTNAFKKEKGTTPGQFVKSLQSRQ